MVQRGRARPLGMQKLQLKERKNLWLHQRNRYFLSPRYWLYIAGPSLGLYHLVCFIYNNWLNWNLMKYLFIYFCSRTSVWSPQLKMKRYEDGAIEFWFLKICWYTYFFYNQTLLVFPIIFLFFYCYWLLFFYYSGHIFGF